MLYFWQLPQQIAYAEEACAWGKASRSSTWQQNHSNTMGTTNAPDSLGSPIAREQDAASQGSDNSFRFHKQVSSPQDFADVFFSGEGVGKEKPIVKALGGGANGGTRVGTRAGTRGGTRGPPKPHRLHHQMEEHGGMVQAMRLGGLRVVLGVVL